MFDDGVGGIHPFETGYAKMADVRFSELVQILPDPDPPNNPSSDNKSGCFIAASAYGSSMEEHFRVLEESRGPFQLTSMPRKVFMGLYHAILRLRTISSLPDLYEVRP